MTTYMDYENPQSLWWLLFGHQSHPHHHLRRKSCDDTHSFHAFKDGMYSCWDCDGAKEKQALNRSLEMNEHIASASFGVLAKE